MTNDAGVWREGLGLMSGSSLDGLDIACCRFRIDPGPPIRVGEWEIAAAETLPIPEEWKERLLHLPQASARDLALAHAQLGQLWGRLSETASLPFLREDKVHSRAGAV